MAMDEKGEEGTQVSEQHGSARRANRRWFIGGVLAVGGAWALGTALRTLRREHAPRPPERETTVVRGGTLIDGTGADPLPNAALVIQGHTITRVGRAAGLSVPHGASVVDASGKWIIPGLVDFHVHLQSGSADARTLLAYGITTVRDTGNSIGALDQLIQDTASGQLPTPTIFACGQILTGEHPLVASISRVLTSTDEAKTAVDQIAGHGFSGVKTGVNLSPALAEAIIDEAHRRGLRVTMHASLPRSSTALTTQARAIELGIDGLEHVFLAISEIASQYPMPRSGAFRWVDLWKAWSGVDLDAPETQRFIQAAVSAKVAWTPTLAVTERGTRIDQSDVTSTPAYELESASIKARWQGSSFSAGWGPDQLAVGQAGFERSLAFTGRLHAAGVNLLAGSDMNNPYTVPGVSMHRELELLVQAGLSPMEALRAATAKPAQALGQGAAFGTLEAGKQADLVILDGDPLANISNINRVVQVMRLGQMYDPSALLSPRTSLEERMSAASPWAGMRPCC